MLKKLRNFPLLVISICMVIGIVFAKSIGDLLLIGGVLGVVVYAAGMFQHKKRLHPAWERSTDAALLLIFIGVGSLTGKINGVKAPVFPDNFLGKKQNIVGIMAAEPKHYAKGYGGYIDMVGYMENDSLLIPYPAKMRVFFDSSMQVLPHIYDTVFIAGKVTEVKSKNISYLNYLHRNGIFISCNIRDIKIAGKQKTWQYYVTNIQKNWSQQLFHIMPDSTTAGIAAAMFLGDNAFLDADTNADFAAAGVSHILAISGQHITIIFMLLNMILAGMEYVRGGKRGKHFLIMLILLVYMLICGAGASVVRSIVMFCIILAAKLLRKQYHILNLLGLAAILQMLISPAIIYNLGFQLSYAAVASIVIFYPYIEAWTKTHSSVWNLIFTWAGVTLAAQILTLPFILTTFGTFPTYFLVSNIALAFWGYVTVIVGFIMLVFAYIPYLNFFLAYITSFLLWGMIYLSRWVADLPHALIHAGDYSGIFFVFLQIGLVAGVVWLLKRRNKDNMDFPSGMSGLERMGLE